MPKVFIGMPVYNGERFIKEAIDSLRAQTFTDWVMLISDNCSEDKTEEICKEFCSNDPRIKYIKQPENLGATNNFKFLLDSADCEYFMWAACDDVWHPDFILSCINNLENDNKSKMAFCNIVNIDTYGRTIADYPDFSKFSQTFKITGILRFLIEPECLGKANIVYSIYKTDFCREIWNIFPINYDWGSDMCFVLAALARTKLIIDKRILFQKRIVRESDVSDKVDKLVIKHVNRGIFPKNEAIKYLNNNLKCLKNTRFYYIGVFIQVFRYIISSLLRHL